MDRVSMFTSQPKVSFSRRVAFRLSRTLVLSVFLASDSLIRALPRILFFAILFLLMYSCNVSPKTGWKMPRTDFNYSFTIDTKKKILKFFFFNFKSANYLANGV